MENNQNLQPTEPVERIEPTTAEPHGNAEPTAEPQTDWKAMARKWEKQAKENKAAADELAKLKEASMTEQELAAKRAEETAAELREAKRKLHIYEAAKTAGIDVNLLERMKGDTPEEIAANAEFIKSALGAAPKYPIVTDNGATAPTTAPRVEIPQII
jgi:hypothetical protein